MKPILETICIKQDKTQPNLIKICRKYWIKVSFEKHWFVDDNGKKMGRKFSIYDSEDTERPAKAYIGTRLIRKHFKILKIIKK